MKGRCFVIPPGNMPLWLLAGLALGVLSACAQADDPVIADWQFEGRADWSPRDSQAEWSLGGSLWIGGGWLDSHSSPPRDLWRSEDGRHWTRVQSEVPWPHSDLAMSAGFQNRLWVMGGWKDGRLPSHAASAAVWSSGDGVEWQREMAEAPWGARLAGGLAVHGGALLLAGGTENYYFGDGRSLKADVWSSLDGRKWRLCCAKAPWQARAYHQMLSFKGRLYLMGGGNYVPQYAAHNDVWSSADGVEWRLETASAPWAPRLWFGVAVYRGRLWVLGGWSKERDNFGDVWHSEDGRHWQLLRTPQCWKARHEHSVLVHEDRLWVLGGHARPLSNEVWSLHLPKDWKP